jgi:dihydrofolate reductase
MWIIGGIGGSGNSKNSVWWSSDGTSWTQAAGEAAFSAREWHTSVVFDNKMWVIGGDGGNYDEKHDVWSSSDGTEWTRATASAAFGGRYSHTSVVFNNKMWVIGGHGYSDCKNDVWFSSDGVTWTQATGAASFSVRQCHTSVVFNNKIWVIGGSSNTGLKNDVWWSPDGVTWTSATLAAAFSARYCHTSVVFDDKMWVIGGWEYSRYANDVWSSPDGVTWTSATLAAAFDGRESHTSVVFNNKMWVIGGIVNNINNPYSNDVWSSPDGASWTRATGAAPFCVRTRHTGVAFVNKMWVIGGWHPYNDYRNDVWLSGIEACARVTPAQVNFGDQPIRAGATAPSIVTLANLYPEGWEPLTIHGITIENDATGAFAFATEPSTRTLLVNDQRDITLQFDPALVGPASADLAIRSNDPTSPTLTVRLTGNGFVPPTAARDWTLLK